ncbi:MAG: hypothetical protein M1826_005861 [Phylliscum demangeonii]|nr:MAG: hypothetical protein M1826_005861 [Phylliscum demangeonii]
MNHPSSSSTTASASPGPRLHLPSPSASASASASAQADAHGHDSKAASVLALVVVLTAMATMATGARLAARRINKAALRADDYTLGLALVLAFGLAAAAIASVRNGLGHHQSGVDVATLENFAKSQYAFVVLYTSCVMLVKISILLLYRTLFATPGFRTAALAAGGYVTALGSASTLVSLFKCRSPIRDGWQPIPSPSAACIDDLAFFLATGALNLLADLAILLLPLPVIWRLRLRRQQKLALSAIFTLGGCACLAAAVRLGLLVRRSGSWTTADGDGPLDSTWILVDPEIWSIIEPCVGVVCACLPTLGPLLRALGRCCRRWCPRPPRRRRRRRRRRRKTPWPGRADGAGWARPRSSLSLALSSLASSSSSPPGPPVGKEMVARRLGSDAV